MIGDPRDVARYYDENTAWFLARGPGRGEGAIHRPVWAPGVATRSQAVHYVHGLLLRELEVAASDRSSLSSSGRPRILDLGCGVGASLRYRLERSPGAGYGITMSARQLELARSSGQERATFLQGDFCHAPLPRDLDLAFGIESFVHASDARAFFENVSGALRPRGRLALVDDFLGSGAAERHEVREFVEGWRAASLVRPEVADDLARSCGLTLESDRDLTAFLRLDRPRDWAVAIGVMFGRPFFRGSLRFQSLSGGHALRLCLRKGFVRYRFRVWRRSAL